MKILMINTFEESGGASLACKRLIEAIRSVSKEEEIEVNLLVLHQSENKKSVQTGNAYNLYLEKLFFLFVEKNSSIRFAFSTACFGTDISTHPLVLNSDIIHLHWINAGFLNLNSLEKLLSLDKKIYWTFHDMWPFTGGCHQSGECENYVNKCGNCNQFLRFDSDNDFSNKIWQRKNSIKGLKNIRVLSISAWMTERIKKSSLFSMNRLHQLPNALNSDIFKKTLYKQEGIINEDRRIKILFIGAVIDNYFKGFGLFLDFLNQLKNRNENIEVILIGSIKNKNLIKIPFPTLCHGVINDENKMVEIYNSSDIFLSTSPNESFSYTVLEAAFCETPVLAFNTGEIENMVNHKIRDFLVENYNTESFVEGFNWLKLNMFENYILTANANLKKYTYPYVGKNILEIYHS